MDRVENRLCLGPEKMEHEWMASCPRGDVKKIYCKDTTVVFFFSMRCYSCPTPDGKYIKKPK